MYIRKFKQQDFNAVKIIYQQGIDTKNATFQAKAKEWNEWDSSMHQSCRLVAVGKDIVLGWAALSSVSSRNVYSGVAEVSLYVSSKARKIGVGHALMKELIVESEREGFWTLQVGIFPENEGSIALHQKNGFRIIGTREKIGQMDSIWRDSILMERRSQVVGI